MFEQIFSLKTPQPNLDIVVNVHLFLNILPKISTNRSNQIELGYFNLHFHRVYKNMVILLIAGEKYY